jgi:hypothetical protein
VAEGALSIKCYFLGEGPNAPFAAIYEGVREGWHMSILYVFSSTGKLQDIKKYLRGNSGVHALQVASG